MVLICLCLLVYDCSEVRLEVRPDGWISVASFSAYRKLQKLLLFSFFCQVFMDHEDDINTFRVLAESVLLLAVPIGSYLCTTGYEKYHYGNHYFLYSAVYSRTELRSSEVRSDRGSPSDHIFVYCCAAGSDFDQGLSENTYYVFPLPGKRGIPGGY